MPFMYRRKHHVPATTVVAPPRRRGLFGRRRAPVRVQQRRPTLKDKVVGAFTRLTGGLTHRSGVKGAGTRRMRGTDGRGSRRPARRFF